MIIELQKQLPFIAAELRRARGSFAAVAAPRLDEWAVSNVPKAEIVTSREQTFGAREGIFRYMVLPTLSLGGHEAPSGSTCEKKQSSAYRTPSSLLAVARFT